MKVTLMLATITTGFVVSEAEPGSSSLQKAQPDSRTTATMGAARNWYANTNGRVPAIAQHNGLAKRLVRGVISITAATVHTTHANAAQVTTANR